MGVGSGVHDADRRVGSDRHREELTARFVERDDDGRAVREPRRNASGEPAVGSRDERLRTLLAVGRIAVGRRAGDAVHVVADGGRDERERRQRGQCRHIDDARAVVRVHVSEHRRRIVLERILVFTLRAGERAGRRRRTGRRHAFLRDAPVDAGLRELAPDRWRGELARGRGVRCHPLRRAGGDAEVVRERRLAHVGVVREVGALGFETHEERGVGRGERWSPMVLEQHEDDRRCRYLGARFRSGRKESKSRIDPTEMMRSFLPKRGGGGGGGGGGADSRASYGEGIEHRPTVVLIGRDVGAEPHSRCRTERRTVRGCQRVADGSCPDPHGHDVAERAHVTW